MAEETLVLFKNIRNPKYNKSLEGYKKAGGYQTLKKVFGMKPEEVVQTVKAVSYTHLTLPTIYSV